MQAKYIAKLMKLLGSERVGEWDTSSEWVMASCPFAPYVKEHTKGTDSRPSFGVHVGKISRYHCFGCGRKGLLLTLPNRPEFPEAKEMKSIRTFITKHEHLGLEDFEKEDFEEPKVEVLSDTVLDRFLDKYHPYLRERGITRETAKLFGLRYDPDRRRIIFPVRDREGRLIGVRGRTVVGDVIKYLTYKDMTKGGDSKHCGHWFGEQMQPKDGKLLFLVEGELDAIVLRQALRKGCVWAAQGVSISKRQVETIKSRTKNPIVILFDDDEAGRAAAQKLHDAIKGFVPKIYRLKTYFGCKDPAEIAQKGKGKDILKYLEAWT